MKHMRLLFNDIACNLRRLACMVLCLALTESAMAQFSVANYKQCLELHGMDPVEYVFRLFEHADVVVLGERDHRDVTQYELIVRLLADPRFATRIGHVYTEVGVTNQTESANRLIKGDWPDETAFREALCQHLRNEDYLFLWEKTNRSIFLDSLYRINRRLPHERRITIGLTDIAFDWSSCHSPLKYKKWLRAYTYYKEGSEGQVRDGVMARNFLRLYKKQTPIDGHRKALLITNQPHAIASRRARTEGWRIKKALGSDRVRVVCLNWYVWTPSGDYGLDSEGMQLIDNGRWDAAFELTGCRPVAFDLAGTPFGDTPLWYWHDGTTWKDCVDGLIFFKPFHQFRGSIGISGILDDHCKAEMQRRLDILFSADEMPTDQWEHAAGYYNTVRSFPIPDNDTRNRMMEPIQEADGK